MAAAARNSLEAERCFQAALEIAHGQQAKFWELRAAYSLACLWKVQGRPTEAYVLLVPAYASLDDHIELPDLNNARRLLEELHQHRSAMDRKRK